MEINIKNEHFPLILAGIATMFVLIVLYTEFGTIGALLLITSIIILKIAHTKLKQSGYIGNINHTLTRIKNHYLRKRIRDPHLRGYTQEEYKRKKDQLKEKSWKINW